MTTFIPSLCGRHFGTRHHANVAYSLGLILLFELNNDLITVTIKANFTKQSPVFFFRDNFISQCTGKIASN